MFSVRKDLDYSKTESTFDFTFFSPSSSIYEIFLLHGTRSKREIEPRMSVGISQH